MRRSASMLRQAMLKLRFLGINYIEKYNNEMGGVDIDDNIRNYNRIYF